MNIAIISDACTGCGLCGDICPSKAIKLEEKDSIGFLLPEIDNSLCIDCGICYNNCPAICYKKNKPQSEIIVSTTPYEIECSSGGAFKALALHALHLGYEICGAAFNENLRLSHTFVNNKIDLQKLLKSKYIQSDCRGLYKMLKAKLDSNSKILFCGTPCQVSAIKNFFLPEYRSQLILIDFLCHGVPSQKIFDEAIANEERSINAKIVNFNFRDKNSDLYDHNFSYTYTKRKKTKEKFGFYYEFPFYSAFTKYDIFRNSCYNCKYGSIERCGDITIGDFWHIEKYSTNFKNKKASFIIQNNKTAFDFCININLGNNEKLPINFLAEDNPSLTSCTEPNISKRKYLLEDYKKYGFNFCAQKYYPVNKKVLIYDKLRILKRKIFH